MDKDNNYISVFKTSYIMKWATISVHILLPVALLLLSYILYTIIFLIKTDVQQGDYYKIIYLHVPSAWMCLLVYTILTLLSLIFILTIHPLLTITIKSLSQIGTLFTAITLVSGSLWGYPMWGAFWVWDARLTSVLILFFIYLIHMIVITKQPEQIKNHKVGAFIAIVGFLNIPIIKYSVEWWTTLHQGPSISQFKTTMDPDILQLLLLVFILFLLLTTIITFYNIKREILEKRISILHK